MNLQMIGIDFQSADIAQRERVALVRGQASSLLPLLVDRDGVQGCVLLVTCGRTELYLHVAEGTEIDPLCVLTDAMGLQAADYRSLCTVRCDRAAVRHLMEVASGMQSQIFGDDQILSQVKDAIALAREMHTADSVLDSLFRRAVTAGKRVKTETRLVGVSTSAADSGVQGAERFFGGLEGRRAVVIGNGEMGRLAATLLRQRGCETTVTLRSYKHGETVVPAGCETYPYDRRYELLDKADLVVSATTSPHYTLIAPQIAALQSPPRLLIDLAMPRDLDSAIAQDKRVTIWNLDDLGRLEDENAEERAHAEKILSEEEKDFYAWYAYRQALPVIAALKDTATERVRYDHAFSGLCEDEDLDGLVALAVNKTVDMLLGGMKEIVDPGRLEACLERMRKGSGK